MKKTTPFLVVFILMIAPQLLQAQSGNYSLTGKVASPPVGTMAYLRYLTPNGSVFDSVLVKNGTFTFKGTIAVPVEAYVVIKPGKSSGHVTGDTSEYREFYLEPADLELNSATNIGASTLKVTPIKGTVDGIGSFNLGNSKYRPGQTNEEDEKVKVFTAEIDKKMKSSLTDYIAELNKHLTDTGKGKAFKERQDLLRIFIKKNESMQLEQIAMLTKFIKAYPDSPVSLEKIRQIFSLIYEMKGSAENLKTESTLGYPLVENAYSLLSDRLKSTSIGKNWKRFIEENK